jgi:hypothetical protein
MFDLEQSIADWRKQMLAAGIKTPVPLEELEIHLRDEIERQMKSGSSEQNAFEVSVQKIGSENSLNDEFEKVSGAKEMRDWKLKQFLLAGSLSAISLLIATLLLFKVGSLREITPAQQMSGLASLALMILLAVGGRFAWRFFPVIAGKRTRDAICISAAVLLALWLLVFSNFVLPRADYTVCQLSITTFWAMCPPVGIFVGLTAGIETAAWKNSAPASS